MNLWRALFANRPLWTTSMGKGALGEFFKSENVRTTISAFAACSESISALS